MKTVLNITPEDETIGYREIKVITSFGRSWIRKKWMNEDGSDPDPMPAPEYRKSPKNPRWNKKKWLAWWNNGHVTLRVDTEAKRKAGKASAAARAKKRTKAARHSPHALEARA